MDKRKLFRLIIRAVVLFAAYFAIWLILINAGFGADTWEVWAIMATVAVLHYVA